MVAAAADGAQAAALAGSVDKTGIELVGLKAIQSFADNERDANALDEARKLAESKPEDMGYPWFEPKSGALEIRAVNDKGRAAGQTEASKLSSGGAKTVVASAPASIAELDGIAEAVTHLSEEGMPGAKGIWKTEPDDKNGRIIITVLAHDDALMAALAERFGTDRIAVRIQNRGPASSASRDSDNPAYWGGAKISTSTGKGCTTGFAWTNGASAAMLTAAHCISTGGKISYPAHANAGTVTSATRENWNDTYGTRYYTGQTTYRGDVALIQYPTGTSSAPYMYNGAPHTSTSTKVKAMASRESQAPDAACVNGTTTGEWCGVVTATRVNAYYVIDGPNVWARRVVQAEALGNTCPTHGDSGGPVYRKQWTDGVAAVGIFSGSVPEIYACAVWFTDIWDAYYGLPGTLKVTG
jgi:hypothetical protein